MIICARYKAETVAADDTAAKRHVVFCCRDTKSIRNGLLSHHSNLSGQYVTTHGLSYVMGMLFNSPYLIHSWLAEPYGSQCSLSVIYMSRISYQTKQWSMYVCLIPNYLIHMYSSNSTSFSISCIRNQRLECNIQPTATARQSAVK